MIDTYNRIDERIAHVRRAAERCQEVIERTAQAIRQNDTAIRRLRELIARSLSGHAPSNGE